MNRFSHIKKFDFGDIIFNKEEDRFYLKIGETIYSGESREKIMSPNYPLALRTKWDITAKCNLNCYYCYAKKSRCCKDLTFGQIKSVIDNMNEAGTMQITFMGGEPFIREDFLDILKYTNSLGIVSTILTNGTFVSDKYFDVLENICLQNIFISFLSPIRKEHDKLTGISGSFDKSIQFITKCKERGIKIETGMCLTKCNLLSSKYFYKLCGLLGVDGKLSMNLHPEYMPDDINNTNYHKYKIDDEIYADNLIKTIKSNPYQNLSVICTSGKNKTISIDSTGNFLLCSMNRKILGNCLNSKIKDLVKLETYKAAIKKYCSRPTKCSSCKAIDYCTLCPADSYILGGDENNVPDILCQKNFLVYDKLKILSGTSFQN